ncbi:MAG: peptidylprolyl isomerase [Actinomycetota bacterium]|nr:peptidylprolyl isomerase [Actinomycetota bacterium]
MRTFRVVVALLLATSLVLAVTGCSSKDVAAKVNGEVIKRSDLDVQIEKLKEQYPDMFTGPDAEGRLLDFQQRLLDNMINNVLIRQAAEEKGIKISDSDVQKQIDTLKENFQSPEQFTQALDQAGMTEDTLKEQVRDQLLTEELIKQISADTPVTEKEIEEYYKANASQFEEKAAVHAAHILFEESDKATAEKVLKELKGGGNFASLAKQYSKDPVSAEKGGDLGWPTTPYVPEFEAAAQKLKADEMSGLVKTTFGYHIIKLIEKRENRQKPIDEVKDQIEQIIVQQRNADAYQKFLDDQRAKADIEILIPELQAAPEAQDATSTAK